MNFLENIGRPICEQFTQNNNCNDEFNNIELGIAVVSTVFLGALVLVRGCMNRMYSNQKSPLAGRVNEGAPSPIKMQLPREVIEEARSKLSTQEYLEVFYTFWESQNHRQMFFLNKDEKTACEILHKVVQYKKEMDMASVNRSVVDSYYEGLSDYVFRLFDLANQVPQTPQEVNFGAIVFVRECMNRMFSDQKSPLAGSVNEGAPSASQVVQLPREVIEEARAKLSTQEYLEVFYTFWESQNHRPMFFLNKDVKAAWELLHSVVQYKKDMDMASANRRLDDSYYEGLSDYVFRLFDLANQVPQTPQEVNIAPAGDPDLFVYELPHLLQCTPIRSIYSFTTEEVMKQLTYPDFPKNTLTGCIMNTAIQLRKEGMADLTPFSSSIFKLWEEDSRTIFFLIEDRATAKNLFDQITDLKDEMTQNLLESKPIIEQQARLAELKTTLFALQDRVVIDRLTELPKPGTCVGFKFQVPPDLDLDCLRHFFNYAMEQDVFITSTWTGWAGHNNSQFWDKLVRSHQNWSFLDPQTAMNRLEVLRSVITPLDMSRNYYIKEHIVKFYQEGKQAPQKGSSVRPYRETEQAALEFCKKNYTITDGLIALMNLFPSTEARKLIATTLHIDHHRIEHFIKEDFQPRFPQSPEEMRTLFKTMKLYLESFFNDYQSCKVHEHLKMIYESEELNGPVRPIKEHVLSAIEENLADYRLPRFPQPEPCCYPPALYEEMRQKLIKELTGL